MRKALAAGWLVVLGLAIALGSKPAVGADDVPKPRPVRSLAYSPDGKVLAAAYGAAPRTGELVAWDVAKRQPRFVHPETVPILSVAYSPDGRLLAIGTFRNNPKLLDAATGEVRRELIGHEGTVRCVAFSPDGKWLATGSYDHTVRLWDVASGEAKHVLAGSHTLRWVGFSPDGKWLAALTPQEQQVRLWRMAALDMPPHHLVVNASILHAAFSPDSRRLAIADSHSALLMYDLAKDDDPERVDHMTLLHWVAFSPNGKWIAGAPPALGVFVDQLGKRASDDAKQREIDALMQQLQDDDLSKREAASERLAAFGQLAAAKIGAAADSPDAEVRDRCRMLMAQMQDGDFSGGISNLQAIPECVVFSPDGQFLACGDWHGGVQIWPTEKRTAASIKLTRESLGPPTKLVSEYTLARGLFPGAQKPHQQLQQQYPPSMQPPFLLVRPAVNALDNVQEFRDALHEGTWEAAFGHLEKLATDSSAALVPEKNGFHLPLRSTLFASLMQMPLTGKNAYRLFHDAEAKVLWDRVQDEQGSAEVETLSRLATIDLVTSVGDLASNRLGDVLFEHGDMDGAINAWQRILECRPDSAIPRIELLIKIATAMTRADRWKEFDEIKQQIAARHAGESVTVAGKKILAADYLAGLATVPAQAENERLDGALPDLMLPGADEPLWQFRYSNSAQQVTTVRNGMLVVVQNQNGAAVDPNASAAVAEGRLFAAVFANEYSLDLETGKIQWTTRRFGSASRQNVYWPPGQSGLAVRGDQIWATSSPEDPQRQMQPFVGRVMGVQAGNVLVRRDTHSGKELWNSGRTEKLKQWAPIGSPVLSADKVYFLARQQNQLTDVHVLAVQISDGFLLWSTPIGSFQVDPRRGVVYPASPVLTLLDNRLYVDTQADGILQLQTDTGAVRWAFQDESATPGALLNTGQTVPAVSTAPGFAAQACVIKGGILYVKRRDSSTLSAIRVAEPTVAWKRSAPVGAVPVAIDNKRIYLAGNEILAYDLKTQKLLWSVQPPTQVNGSQPLVTRHRYYQLTSNGVVEIDTTTGTIVRTFRGADLGATGGRILVTPKMLITVTDRAITAYPLGRHDVESP